MFEICCGFGMENAEDKTRQSNLGRQPIRVQFSINHDPGHGGSLEEFSLERNGEKFLVKSCKSRHFPQPGEKDFKPLAVNGTEERSKEEVERFLNVLVNDLKIGKLQSLKSPILLHPTFYTFEMRYADGHIRRFNYVIEAGHHLDERYRQLINECESFFRVK